MLNNSLIIVKIGGNVLDDEESLTTFLHDFARLPQPKILVHGGGKIASEIGVRLGLESRYVDGRRVTDEATRDLVTMVYGGLINRQLTARLQALGCDALGLTGADANLLPAGKRPADTVDYGWVGDVSVERVNTDRLLQWLGGGLTPVLAPLTHDGQGHMLNTNADTIAATVAIALSAHFRVRLLFCFEHRGILSDLNDPASHLPVLSRLEFRRLQEQAGVSGGILPKLDNAFAAAEAGVATVVIGHAADLLRNAGEGDIPGTTILVQS